MSISVSGVEQHKEQQAICHALEGNCRVSSLKPCLLSGKEEDGSLQRDLSFAMNVLLNQVCSALVQVTAMTSQTQVYPHIFV